MDFQNVNPFNACLNKLSGNLLPMTSDDPPFPTAWRIYSAVLLLAEVVQVIAIIPAVMYVSREKILQDATVGVVISAEAFFLFARMHMHRNLVSRLIRKLNDILRTQDQTMESIVRSTLKPVQTPLKFYWIAGSVSLIIWCCMSFLPVLKRSLFFYEDYRVPVAFTKQPFSMRVFLVGNLVVSVTSVYIFMRKVALDVYTINLVLLVTAQYRYISTKLTTIFQIGSSRNQHDEPRKIYSDADSWTETEMRVLCHHHNAIICMTPILKKLLSMNFSLIYLNNVFRFCFNGIMLVIALTSAPLEALMILMYLSGGLVQLYILCLCAHQLLDACFRKLSRQATRICSKKWRFPLKNFEGDHYVILIMLLKSIEVTDKAFHEKWYQFGSSLKHTFLLMITANNLDPKLAACEKFNLSLPSFMTILNHSYSVALLFLRVR